MEPLGILIDLALALGAALVGGMLARLLRQPVVVGYILGGIAVGPVLGLVRDVAEVRTLASIGVVFLLFGLGVQFSFKELRRIGRVALLGGVLEIGLTIAAGTLISRTLGFPFLEAIFFGSMVAMTSTAVVLKVLMERGELETLHGRVLIGFMIAEDLSVVAILIVLSALGRPEGHLATTLTLAGLKALAVLGAAFLLGTKLVPWLVKRVALAQSRELFLLLLIMLATSTAYVTQLMGLSLALGAFLAGIIISESDFAQQALADIAPLRDTFAALFFATLGMLFVPAAFAADWLLLLKLLGLALAAKIVIGALVSYLFGYGGRTALLVGLGLIPVGEFSFVIAQAGLADGLISERLASLMLGSVLLSVLLAPSALTAGQAFYARLYKSRAFSRVLSWRSEPLPESTVEELHDHVVIVGYGNVGMELARALQRRKLPLVCIDLDPRAIHDLRVLGVPYVYGDAANVEVLTKACLDRARVMAVTCPDPPAAELVVRAVKRLNPGLDIVVVARLEREDHVARLRALGAAEVVRPRYEAALEVVRHTLHRYGLTATELQHFISTLRDETPSYEERPREDADEEAGEPVASAPVREHVRVRRRRWY
ncbi:MAG: cation:proton antiporter [Chloroflexi bacterium]|nr:cation:proton antiporter [Chloroflexota bacterium]